MNRQKQPNVTIKGTKEGLTLHLSDTCSFKELLDELELKLSTNQYGDDQQLVHVKVNAGNRYVTSEQEEQIKALIRKKKYLIVDEIECNVITKEEAIQQQKKNEIISVARIVRSGQILQVEGDLLLLGDVNPGGTVIAAGSIFVVGALRGIAHAGYDGNRQAVVAASLMKPAQLRISEVYSRGSDRGEHEDGGEMECAYVNESDEILVERVQSLMHLRPNLTRLERRS
ncbi:septum site-determining protein MinC [Priestia koreensis]|uniref:septum site-determining protein MinC n=1 Tax=Priestia koreensis TaxID=284581 RepID=UPI001F578E2E|nr:septum site-determining protein MinC [Priestia koreensis]MCM3002643.1 septum site-determining protein MinC [Priestia koreensis]UNL84347.1 septum site-determining protein MinC [Priestia koreensis]